MIFEPNDEDRQRRDETAGIRAVLAERIARYVGDDRERAAPLPGLSLIQVREPIPPTGYLYEPCVSIIVRGRKRVVLGDTTYFYDESQFLLTAVNLPTVTEVLQATADAPYISLLMKLDLQASRQLIADVDEDDSAPLVSGAGMATGPATVELFDAVARLIALFDKPRELPHLAPLVQREILYRILSSPAGARFRETVLMGTQSHKIARAISWLRENFTHPLKVEKLAELAGMGVSTLHRHFRAMTAMSPLQYQKHLRLHEARNLLMAEHLDATTVAIRVGYESATQFNREYRRLFGAPPIRDVKTFRAPAEGAKR